MHDGFDRALALVLRWEGGFVDDPADPGGATNRGITLATLSAARGRPATRDDVKALGLEETAAIYRTRYWDAVQGDVLPAGVDVVVFDAAVHSGPRQAVRWLQQALGVAADGRIGPVTMAALAAADPASLIRAMTSRRLAMLETLPGAGRFGRGWTRRVNGARDAALRWAVPPPAPPQQGHPPIPSSPSLQPERTMTDVKSILASRTIWSNLIGLAAIGLAAAGYDSTGLDAGRLMDAGLQIVTAASFIASSVFRVLATRRLAT